MGDTPIFVDGGIPPLRLDGCTTRLGLDGVPPPSRLDGALPQLGLDGGTLPLELDGSTPPQDSIGVPPSGIGNSWTGYAACDTPLAVSRRRTFLYLHYQHYYHPHPKDGGR